jgi:hypothetical protein
MLGTAFQAGLFSLKESASGAESRESNLMERTSYRLSFADIFASIVLLGMRVSYQGTALAMP